jgi:hypothetical protein
MLQEAEVDAKLGHEHAADSYTGETVPCGCQLIRSPEHDMLAPRPAISVTRRQLHVSQCHVSGLGRITVTTNTAAALCFDPKSHSHFKLSICSRMPAANGNNTD